MRGSAEFSSPEERQRWWNEAGRRQLRQLLFWRWDPIGVNDAFPETHDEYRSYAGGVADVLYNGGGAVEIEEHLRLIEHREMEISTGTSKAAAQAIVDWYPVSINYWRSSS